MIYKPEHVTDLESGAIVQAEILEGDHADTKALSERVACAVEVVNRIIANEQDGVVRSLTADKGYFAIEEIAQIQEFDIRTVIGDANAARRPEGKSRQWQEEPFAFINTHEQRIESACSGDVAADYELLLYTRTEQREHQASFGGPRYSARWFYPARISKLPELMIPSEKPASQGSRCQNRRVSVPNETDSFWL